MQKNILIFAVIMTIALGVTVICAEASTVSVNAAPVTTSGFDDLVHTFLVFFNALLPYLIILAVLVIFAGVLPAVGYFFLRGKMRGG